MNTQADPVVIVSMARTPLGAFQGELSSLSAPQLGAVALQAALARSGLAPDAVDEVLMGCVLTAGQGQAPARQAALLAGLSQATPCTTISKVCGSGMKALMLAHDQLLAGSAQVVLAGGMESMSQAPYLLPKARGGQRLGHGQMLDHLFLDGLEDAYSPADRGRLMGTFAEDCASDLAIGRAQQDAWAVASTERARQAWRAGAYDTEVAPVTVSQRGQSREVSRDELPFKVQLERVASLAPVFRPDGTVTAANASAIADGAAALMLMRRSTALQHGLAPLATVCGHATHAQAPAHFTTAPAAAITKLMQKLGWRTQEVDLWEINEAFAVVTLAAIQALGLPPERVNAQGGACSLGHPIGATGARIVVTLLAALQRQGLSRGVASLCIGGGEATALALSLS